MSQNRYYSSDALPTTLAAAITSNTTTSISVNSVTGNPSSFPYTMLIDWGLPTQEAVSVTAVSGSGPYTLTVVRGIDETTAQTHINGAIIVHGVTEQDYNEPQVHIGTGTSSGSYPGVIHGLQSGSSVVGTTDTQTLTNKTLGATSFSGALTASQSASTGEIISVTNSHSSPSNPNVEITSANGSDLAFGIDVSGDTDNRFQINASGKMQWGAGGASSVDTDLYRASSEALQTDGDFTVGSALTAETGSITASSSTGELLQVTNNTGAPTNPNLIVWSDSATDPAMSARVIADTHSRLHILANGQISWGTGSASTDTDLYRSADGVLSTDDTFTATEGLQIGGTTTTFGSGVGVLGLTETSTPPSSDPSGGIAVYANTSGHLRYYNPNGIAYSTSSIPLIVASSSFTTTSTSAVTITGLSTEVDAAAYIFYAMLVYSVTAGTATFSLSTPTVSNTLWTYQPQTSSYTQPTIETSSSSTFTGALTSNSAIILQGTITFSAAGTFALKALISSSSDTLTVVEGSFCELTLVG